MANFSKVLANTKKCFAKHRPEILIGIGIAGMITTTVLAVKGTTKAVRLLDARKEELETDKLSIKETVKTTWKCYIPTVTTCAASIGCIIGANSMHLKRNAALAAAYKFSETAFNEYRNQVVKTIGEKKEKDIQHSVEKQKIDEHPASKSSVIITGDGKSLCYDIMNDRYFESSYDRLKKVENIVNRELILSDYISLNSVYDELGLKHIPSGDKLGWNTAFLGKEGLEICIDTHMTDDGRPCLSMRFSVPPRYKFDMFY